jgi:hypothetical protein
MSKHKGTPTQPRKTRHSRVDNGASVIGAADVETQPSASLGPELSARPGGPGGPRTGALPTTAMPAYS